MAHADPVITYIGTTTVSNGGVAPGSATDYDFFGVPASHLTNFSVSTFYDSYPGNGGYTFITAPDGTGPFRTGTAYNSAIPDTVVLASFNTTFSGSFSVYILNGNADASFVEDSTIGLGANNGEAVNSNALQAITTNQFNIYNVTGASPTDVFQVYGTANTGVDGAESNVGGLTFGPAISASPVPEPSSLILLGTGVLGTLTAARRRFLKA